MKYVLRVYKKTVSITSETPIGIYESLGRENIGYLLESYDKNNGRYTFIGIEPDELIQSRGNSLVITRKNGETEVLEGNPYEKIKEYYSRFEILRDEGELAFGGGFVGSMGYDFVKYVEELPDENPDEIGIETIQFMFAKRFLVIDHVAETMSAVVLDEDSQEGKLRAMDSARELLERAVRTKTVREDKVSLDGKIINKTDTVESYGRKVNTIKNYIKEGHIFQTVLSQRWTIETKDDGFALYKRLRELNPSPYLYYFNFGDFEIIGSSPEMIVKQSDNKVYTCPIAGTRK